MIQRTRIVVAMRAGNRLTHEISAATGISRYIVQIRLAELQRRRVVRSSKAKVGRHGNEKIYQLANP